MRNDRPQPRDYAPHSLANSSRTGTLVRLQCTGRWASPTDTGVSPTEASPFSQFCTTNLAPISQSVRSSMDCSLANPLDLTFSETLLKYESTKCKCKKSRCRKLYCVCFASGNYCIDCECKFCHNKQGTSIEEKLVLKQMRGCRCKKSQCKKKYCECFQINVSCGDSCFCVGCKNR